MPHIQSIRLYNPIGKRYFIEYCGRAHLFLYLTNRVELRECSNNNNDTKATWFPRKKKKQNKTETETETVVHKCATCANIILYWSMKSIDNHISHMRKSIKKRMKNKTHSANVIYADQVLYGESSRKPFIIQRKRELKTECVPYSPFYSVFQWIQSRFIHLCVRFN